MMVRPADHRTKEQIAFLDQIVKRDPLIATAFTLTQEFGQHLAPASRAKSIGAMESGGTLQWEYGTHPLCRWIG
jgi:hypothetical protein